MLTRHCERTECHWIVPQLKRSTLQYVNFIAIEKKKRNKKGRSPISLAYQEQWEMLLALPRATPFSHDPWFRPVRFWHCQVATPCLTWGLWVCCLSVEVRARGGCCCYHPKKSIAVESSGSWGRWIWFGPCWDLSQLCDPSHALQASVSSSVLGLRVSSWEGCCEGLGGSVLCWLVHTSSWLLQESSGVGPGSASPKQRVDSRKWSWGTFPTGPACDLPVRCPLPPWGLVDSRSDKGPLWQVWFWSVDFSGPLAWATETQELVFPYTHPWRSTSSPRAVRFTGTLEIITHTASYRKHGNDSPIPGGQKCLVLVALPWGTKHPPLSACLLASGAHFQNFWSPPRARGGSVLEAHSSHRALDVWEAVLPLFSASEILSSSP